MGGGDRRRLFTGIVEEVGRVRAVEAEPGLTRLRLEAGTVLDGLGVGDSIAVNGACLTVVEHDAETFLFQAGPETLRRTNLGELKEGDRVNLERSLRFGDRLGGHLVQGHVDAVGEVAAAAPELLVVAPHTRYLVEKGSVAVDGVSLTVVDVGDDGFTVAVIPHTASATTLGRRRPGDRVNLEFDLVAKYVERLTESR